MDKIRISVISTSYIRDGRFVEGTNQIETDDAERLKKYKSDHRFVSLDMFNILAAASGSVISEMEGAGISDMETLVSDFFALMKKIIDGSRIEPGEIFGGLAKPENPPAA